MRSTCAAYLASSGNYSEYLLKACFGYGMRVSMLYYRQPIQRIEADTVEEVLGAIKELANAAIVLTVCQDRS